MSLDITGALAPAVAAIDPTALDADRGAPIGPSDNPVGLPGSGDESVTFIAHLQHIEGASLEEFELLAPRPRGPSTVVAESPVQPAATSQAPLPAGVDAATDATWVPDRGAAWFALRSPAALGAGGALPPGGNTLPQAQAPIPGAPVAAAAQPTQISTAAPPPPGGHEPAAAASGSQPLATQVPGAAGAVAGHAVAAAQPAAATRGNGPRRDVPSPAAPQVAMPPTTPPDLASVASIPPGRAGPISLPDSLVWTTTPADAGGTGPLAAGRGSAQAQVQSAPLPPLQPGRSDGAWDRALGQRVVFMAQAGVETAQLRLDPPHLGPVQVRIAMQDDQAQLLFQAQHVHTREALEAALPRLREMFAQEGLQLDSARVDGRSPDTGQDLSSGRDGRDASRTAPAPGRAAETATRAPDADVVIPAPGGPQRGLIDEFV